MTRQDWEKLITKEFHSKSQLVWDPLHLETREWYSIWLMDEDGDLDYSLFQSWLISQGKCPLFYHEVEWSWRDQKSLVDSGKMGFHCLPPRDFLPSYQLSGGEGLHRLPHPGGGGTGPLPRLVYSGD